MATTQKKTTPKTAKKTTRKKTAKKATSKKTPRKAVSAAKPEVMKSAPKKPTKVSKPKRVSLLDAAATVLASAKEPMQAKAIVDAVVEQGLWKPGAGRTPHATLYAAIIREITKKGDAAHFRKVERGQFAARD